MPNPLSFRHLALLLLGFFALMLALVWPAPLAFTATSAGSKWMHVAYALTESGGKYGTAAIIVLTSLFYSLRFERKRDKTLNFFKSLIALGAFLGIFAFANEHLIKKAARIPRPSHLYIFEQAKATMPVDSLYRFESAERHKLLRGLIETQAAVFAQVDEKVLSHWIEEDGYSFPSGHSFNAFLLASVLCFSLQRSRTRLANYFYLLPPAWAVSVAVSRVAIGAHSALDVSFGALMGVLVALGFLYFDNTRRLILQKQHHERSEA